MKRTSWFVRVRLLWVMVLLVGAVPVPALAQTLRFGQDIDLGRSSGPESRAPLPGGSAEAPYLTRVELRWNALSDTYDMGFADIERRLRRLREAHHRLILSIRADDLSPVPGVEETGVLDVWMGRLRLLSKRLGDDLVAIEPLRGGSTVETATRDAFFMKRAAVAIRSVAPDVQVVLGLEGNPPQAAWLDALYEAGVGPYVDVLAWHREPEEPAPSPTEMLSLLAVRLSVDPAAPLWVLGLPGGGQGASSEAALLARLAPAGATVLTFRTPSPAHLEHLQARLGNGFSPMTGGGVDIVAAGSAVDDRFVAAAFFNADTAIVEIVLVPLPGAPERVELVLHTFDVSSPVLFDLESGRDRFLGGAMPDRRTNRTQIALPSVTTPSLLEYQRFATPGTGREDVEVGEQRDPPVEEILASYQQVDDAQDEAVHTVRADVEIEFHYAVAGYSTSVDVTFHSRYYWDESTGGEFEHLELLINGARWKQKKLPELPLIQPEKVVTLPLDIHLRKQYRYELKGRDSVAGRAAWRIAFDPLDPVSTRYRGTLWIDQEDFRLLKTSVIQTALEAPVRSSEEASVYEEYPLPGGGQASLVGSMTGQQLWNTAGASFIVSREMRFKSVQINDADFETARQVAYDGEHQMLRDTNEGLRYVKQNDAGERVVQPVATRTRVAIAGGFYNEALDFPVPFVGISWFDFDFRDKGEQLNLFLAGAANFGTWSDPSFFGTRADASLSGSLIGFNSRDRFLVGDTEVEAFEISSRRQRLSVSIGYPVGQFIKLRGFLGVDHNHYERSDDTGATFIPPEDTLTLSVSSQVQFNRRGLTASVESGRFERTDWDPWGDPDPASPALGSRLADFDSKFETYETWSAALSQDIFLKSFQKIRVEGVWLDGSDLDRFSQYRFSFFGGQTRMRGFSGSGIRFNRGGILRARYSFNVADVVSFDAGLDYARVQNTFTGLDKASHTGFGVAGKFIGPWGVIVQVEYGLVLNSAFEGVEGEQEAQLLLLKIF